MKIKRLAAIILAAAVFCSMFTAVKAVQDDGATTAPITTEVSTTTEPGTTAPTTTETSTTAPTTTAPTTTVPITTEPTTRPPVKPPVQGDVAEISVCTKASGFPAFFHTFIYIHNISSETLRVGVYDLPPGEGVSVGTWALAVFDGWGVYYNVEAYASRNRDKYDYFTLTKTLDKNEFEKVSEEICRFNWWDPIFNCTVFVYRVWNAAGGKWMLPLPLPWITEIQMALYGGRIGNLEMFAPDESRVYRQRGWGEDARLEEVNDWTRNTLVASFNGKKSDVTT